MGDTSGAGGGEGEGGHGGDGCGGDHGGGRGRGRLRGGSKGCNQECEKGAVEHGKISTRKKSLRELILGNHCLSKGTFAALVGIDSVSN